MGRKSLLALGSSADGSPQTAPLVFDLALEIRPHQSKSAAKRSSSVFLRVLRGSRFCLPLLVFPFRLLASPASCHTLFNPVESQPVALPASYLGTSRARNGKMAQLLNHFRISDSGRLRCGIGMTERPFLFGRIAESRRQSFAPHEYERPRYPVRWNWRRLS
jgi:hypothetical protein